MQTQGITFGSATVSSHVSRSSSKAENAGFERIMSRNVSEGAQRENAKASKDVRKSANVSNDTRSRHNVSLTEKNAAKSTELEEADIESVEDKVVLLLQKAFGLSEDEVVDILEQLGMTPMDLILMMSQDSTQVMPIPTDNIKNLVMEVHGTEDANAFLVSDTMCQELNDVMQGLQDILSQELGVDVEHFDAGDADVLRNFADKWEELLETYQNVPEEVSGNDEIPGFSDAAVAQSDVEVMVETTSEFESGTGDGDSVAEAVADATLPEMEVSEDNPIQVFADRLNESYESLSGENVNATQPTMNHIVEQVVRHVRIRVLPQTTSMELQLNPESLGRVNLTVTSQNGTSTATLTVQNEVAKEALESQITVLKENLESHGLKVESVEVTVSEFGFKNPEDSNHGAHQRKKSNHRRLRLDSAETVLEEATIEAEERQDGTSVVDYTA